MGRLLVAPESVEEQTWQLCGANAGVLSSCKCGRADRKRAPQWAGVEVPGWLHVSPALGTPCRHAKLQK